MTDNEQLAALLQWTQGERLPLSAAENLGEQVLLMTEGVGNAMTFLMEAKGWFDKNVPHPEQGFTNLLKLLDDMNIRGAQLAYLWEYWCKIYDTAQIQIPISEILNDEAYRHRIVTLLNKAFEHTDKGIRWIAVTEGASTMGTRPRFDA